MVLLFGNFAYFCKRENTSTTMARILTGVQATGRPHLGNILGAILPAIKAASQSEDESFLFIADLHSLTLIKNAQELRENTYAVAKTWLAMGLDTSKTVFYRQSDVPQTTELTWYLDCFFPLPAAPARTRFQRQIRTSLRRQHRSFQLPCPDGRRHTAL